MYVHICDHVRLYCVKKKRKKERDYKLLTATSNVTSSGGALHRSRPRGGRDQKQFWPLHLDGPLTQISFDYSSWPNFLLTERRRIADRPAGTTGTR